MKPNLTNFLPWNIPMLKLEHMKRIARIRFPNSPKSKGLAALAAGLLAVSGCGHSTVINTQAGGHQIRAVIAGNHSLNSQPESATITSAFGTVTVERTRVQIGSAPWNKIPEAVPVELSMSKGRIALTAGSVTIKQTIH
jgi:hypothetical protein